MVALRSLDLVVNDISRAAIVVADARAEAPVRFAAEELRRYIALMSGADLPLRDAAEGPAVVLATGDVPGGEDAFRMRTEDGRLYLTGASPRAVLYAAYALLERLGCTFAVPGEDTVPRCATLSVPELDVLEAPVYTRRSLVDFPFTDAPPAWHPVLIDWLAKNRYNWYHPAPNAFGEPTAWYERRDKILTAMQLRGLHLQFGGHTLHTWLPPQRYFSEHPEWFAKLRRGRKWVRQAPLVCVSHPEARRAVAENIIAFLDCCPEAEIIDIWEADIQEFCQCADCVGAFARTRDEETTRTAYLTAYMELLNTVAGLVAARHPRVKISGSIYAPHGGVAPLRAPAMAENVLLEPAHIMRHSYLPITESTANLRILTMDMSWRQKAREVVLYEYYSAWTNSGIYPIVNVMAEDLRLLHQLGFTGVETDQGGWTALNTFAAGRLLWQPEQPWKGVIAAFCRYYGEAADAMTAYWVGLEHALREQPGFIADLGGSKQTLLAYKDDALATLAALRDAACDPVTRARLARETIPWEHFGERPYLRYALPDRFAHHWPPAPAG